MNFRELTVTIILMVTVNIAGFLVFSSERFKADDDYLWFYLQGSDLNYSDKSHEIYEIRNEFMTCNEASDEYKYRSVLRQKLHKNGNYYGASLFFPLAREILDNFTNLSMTKNYPEYLSSAMWLGFALNLAFVLALMAITLSLIRDQKLQSAILVASSLLFVIGVYSFYGWSVSGRLIDQGPLLRDPLKLLVNDLLYLANPAPAFTPFDMPPKARFQLLLMVAFLARWKSMYFVGYLLLLPMSLLHQSYAGIVLFFMVFIDFVIRPKDLRDTRIAAVISLLLLAYVVRGYLWKDAVLALDSGILWLAFAVIILIVAGLFKTILRLVKRIMTMPIYQKLVGLPNYQSDLLLHFTLWFVSLIAFIPLSLAADTVSSHYLWGQVHGRISGLFYPVYVTGIVLFFINSRWFSRLDIRNFGYASVLFSFMAVILVWGFSGTDFINRVTLEAEEHEEKIRSPLKVTEGERGEYLYFYAMSKQLDTGQNLISDLMSYCKTDNK